MPRFQDTTFNKFLKEDDAGSSKRSPGHGRDAK
jgi:hypothetical protein